MPQRDSVSEVKFKQWAMANNWLKVEETIAGEEERQTKAQLWLSSMGVAILVFIEDGRVGLKKEGR